MRRAFPLLLLTAVAYAAPSTVTVAPGDTLYRIAHERQLTVAQLKALNGLSKDVISVGQVLKVSGPVKAASTPKATTSRSKALPPKIAPPPKAAVSRPATSQPAVKAPIPTTYTVKSGDSLDRIARQYGLTVARLKAINGLSGDVVQVGQKLKLSLTPAGAAARPEVQKPKPAPAKPPVKPDVYTVRAGDTLGRIAERHAMPLSLLKALNSLGSDTISVGQQLRLRGPVPRTAATRSQPPAKAASPQASTYQVQPGDTLEKIALRHSLNVAKLKALNGLTGDVIRVGQKLNLRGGAAAGVAAPARSSVYIVKSGDTLGKIAERYGVSVGAIQSSNRLTGTVILVGQRLSIPPRGSRTPVAPSIPPGMEVRTVYTYERVGPRDTPQSFAERYNSSADQIRRLNSLGSVNQMVHGAKLLVPRRMVVPIPPPAQRGAATFRQVTVDNVAVQVVSVDLRHRDVLVAPVLPARGLSFRSGATVRALTQRSGAQAVVNGSFFHPQTYAPAGDIVMQGRLLTWGRLPAALAITPDNRASITASTTPLFGRPSDSTWSGMETVVAAGPRIVTGGAVQTNYSRVFQDPAVFGRAARSAIGLLSSRDLIMVSTHAKLTTVEMGKVMAALGARDALLLDGGSSAGLSWNGSVILDSIRKVSYGIGVFTKYTGRRYSR